MYNGIIMADWHIHDFAMYNPTPHFRLNQNISAANRIVDIGKINNAKDLYILGDTVNVPMITPVVYHMVTECFKILVSYYDNIYIILGQHDMNYKGSEDNPESTFITCLCDISTKIKYMHDKFITVEGKVIYMRNWTPVKKFPVPDGTNIYLSHMSLGMGQELEKDVELGIFGDIHEPVKIGNNYSVSTPYQLYPHQPEDGLVGLLTIDNKGSRYTRVKMDTPELVFLKLKKTEEYKSNPTFSMDENTKTSILSSESIYTMIDEMILKESLTDVHNLIDKSNLPQPINFEFILKSLHIKNFRSIKDLKLEFDKLGKVLLLSGANGSGKSSIIYALYTALKGDPRIKKYNRKPKHKCELHVVFDYRGIEYSIKRGDGVLEYKVGKEVISLNNKREEESRILSDLPFIQYLDYFFIFSNSHFFDKVDRIQLFKTCFNLSIFDYLLNKGKELKKSNITEINKIDTDINFKSGSVKSLEEAISESRLKIASHPGSVIDITGLSDKLNRVNTLTGSCKIQRENLVRLSEEINSLSIWDGKLESEYNISEATDKVLELNEYSRLLNEGLGLENRLHSLEDTLNKSKITCPKCSHAFMLDKDREDKLILDISNTKSSIDNVSIKLDNLKSKTSGYKTIEEYSEIIKSSNSAISNIRKLASSRLKYNTDKPKYDSDLAELLSLLEGKTVTQISDDIGSKIREYNEYRSLISFNSNQELQLSNINTELNNLKIKLKSLQDKDVSLSKYICIFDPANLDSIPYKILDKVVKTLNTDLVKFSTTKELSSGEDRFEISCQIKVDEEFIDYDLASDGQKVFLDLFIINRVFSLLGNVGCLVFDEALANVDKYKYDLIREFMTGTTCSKILVSSHSDLFTGQDNILQFELDKGISNVTIT